MAEIRLCDSCGGSIPLGAPTMEHQGRVYCADCWRVLGGPAGAVGARAQAGADTGCTEKADLVTKTKKNRAWAAAVATLIVVGGIAWLSTRSSSCMSGERSPRIAPLDKSPEMQAQRKAFLAETIRDGYFTKVEPGSGIPKVWVTLKFMGVDFEAKGALISVVYAYYFDGSNDYAIVQLKEARTGRVVGDYYIAQGGLKMRG